MAHATQCYNCKKFAKEISKKKERKTTYRILKCKNCGEFTLSSISYYLAVHLKCSKETPSKSYI